MTLLNGEGCNETSQAMDESSISVSVSVCLFLMLLSTKTSNLPLTFGENVAMYSRIYSKLTVHSGLDTFFVKLFSLRHSLGFCALYKASNLPLTFGENVAMYSRIYSKLTVHSGFDTFSSNRLVFRSVIYRVSSTKNFKSSLDFWRKRSYLCIYVFIHNEQFLVV